MIKWGRGEGEPLSIHVVWTQCALGLSATFSQNIPPLNNSPLHYSIHLPMRVDSSNAVEQKVNCRKVMYIKYIFLNFSSQMDSIMFFYL